MCKYCVSSSVYFLLTISVYRMSHFVFNLYIFLLNCHYDLSAASCCSTQDCPEGSKDFREEQCSQFDGTDFQGKRYKWLPYYGGQKWTYCGSVFGFAWQINRERAYLYSKTKLSDSWEPLRAELHAKRGKLFLPAPPRSGRRHTLPPWAEGYLRGWSV